MTGWLLHLFLPSARKWKQYHTIMISHRFYIGQYKRGLNCPIIIQPKKSSGEKPKVNRLLNLFWNNNIVRSSNFSLLWYNQALSLTTGFVCSRWWDSWWRNKAIKTRSYQVKRLICRQHQSSVLRATTLLHPLSRRDHQAPILSHNQSRKCVFCQEQCFCT